MDDGDGSGGGICNPFTQDCGGNITDDIDVGEGGGITLGSLCSAPRKLDSNAKQGTLFKRRSAACVKDEISAPSSRQR